MKLLIVALLMMMVLVNSQTTLIQTVEQCSNCLNTAGSRTCNSNPDIFTSTCCPTGDTSGVCSTTSVCSNSFQEGAPISSKFLLCPSPNECGFTDFAITELDKNLTLTFNQVPAGFFCRVRVIIGKLDLAHVDFTNIQSTNVQADIYFTNPDETSGSRRMTYEKTVFEGTSPDKTMDISQFQSIYMMLTPMRAGATSFTISMNLRRYERDYLSTTELPHMSAKR